MYIGTNDRAKISASTLKSCGCKERLAELEDDDTRKDCPCDAPAGWRYRRMDMVERRAYLVLQDSQSSMSTLDTVVLDYVMSVKSNWSDWTVKHGKMFTHNSPRPCQFCKSDITGNQNCAWLNEHESTRCCWHEPCLELCLKENPDLRGRLRL